MNFAKSMLLLNKSADAEGVKAFDVKYNEKGGTYLPTKRDERKEIFNFLKFN